MTIPSGSGPAKTPLNNHQLLGSASPFFNKVLT
jgi:hypothetical protein